MPQRFRVDDEHRPLQTVSHSVHSSLISQPIILQPPLQFRLVGYKNALLQG